MRAVYHTDIKEYQSDRGNGDPFDLNMQGAIYSFFEEFTFDINRSPENTIRGLSYSILHKGPGEFK